MKQSRAVPAMTPRGQRIGPVLAALLLPIGLAACATISEPPQPYVCVLPTEKRMLVAELFFGRGIPGRAPLSEAEWRDFAAEIVTPNFPDGFTAFDAEGQWRNPATGQSRVSRRKCCSPPCRAAPTSPLASLP